MTLVHLENPAGWIGTKRSTYDLVRAIIHKDRKTPVSRLVREIVGATERDAVSIQAFVTLREQYGDEAGVIVDSVVFGVPLASDADNVSQPVLDELDHLRHDNPDFDIHHLHDVAEALKQYHDHGWDPHFAGHVGDVVAHDNMPGSTLPESASQEAYDVTDAHGVEWQVKTGKTAARMAREHFEKHPDTPVITNDGAAETLQAEHLHAVGMTDLDTDHLRELVDSTTVSIRNLADMHPMLPIVATILATHREAARWRRGEISASQMVGNIAITVSSRSACMFLVTSATVLLSASAGIVAVAGPLIAGGAIVGGMLGTEIGDELLNRNVVAKILDLRLGPIREPTCHRLTSESGNCLTGSAKGNAHLAGPPLSVTPKPRPGSSGIRKGSKRWVQSGA